MGIGRVAARMVLVVVVDDRVLVVAIAPVAIVLAGGVVGMVDVVMTAAVMPGGEDGLGHDMDICGVDDAVAVDVGVRTSSGARVVHADQDMIAVGAIERTVAVGVDRDCRVADGFVGARGKGADGGEDEGGG